MSLGQSEQTKAPKHAGQTWMIVGVAMALLAGALMRWIHLGWLSLWTDEGYTAWAENHPAGEIIRLIRADTAPPLYYVLLHYWTDLFGRSEAGLRAFSALLGTVQVPLVAAIAWQALRKPGAAVAAAWIFAFSFLQIWYSQEARFYEMMSFLTAVMLYCLLRYLDEPGGAVGWLAGIGIALAAGLYTHNMILAFTPGLIGAWLILPSRRSVRRRVVDGLIVAAGVMVVYLPWAASLLGQIHRVKSGFWIVRPTWDLFFTVIGQLCGIQHSWTWDRHFSHFNLYLPTLIPQLVALAVVVALAIAGVRLGGGDRRMVFGLALFALLPPILTAAYSVVGTPIFIVRAFIGSTVPMAVLTAGALAWAVSPRGRLIARGAVGLAVVLVTVSGLAFLHDDAKENWRRAAGIVSDLPPVRSRLILFVAADCELPFDYYYKPRPGEIVSAAPRDFFDTDPPQTLGGVHSDADLDHVRELLASHSFDDCVLMISHAGYVDTDGRIKTAGRNDEGALTHRYFRDRFPLMEHVDLGDVQYFRFRLE